jgi:hypothetical protein
MDWDTDLHARMIHPKRWARELYLSAFQPEDLRPFASSQECASQEADLHSRGACQVSLYGPAQSAPSLFDSRISIILGLTILVTIIALGPGTYSLDARNIRPPRDHSATSFSVARMIYRSSFDLIKVLVQPPRYLN